MVVREFFLSVLLSGVCSIAVFIMLGVADAQVRTSSNYQLQSDSLNVGGGLSSSSAYTQENTVGEIATGFSDSASYALRAGYQQMQEVYLSLAVSGDVFMTPDLPGITGGTANGSTTATVVTDGAAGYLLTLEAENSPAMRSGGESIPDYNEGAEADFSFTTSGAEAFFGFSPEGVDITQRFLDDTAVCGQGSYDSPLACWAGPSTTAQVIARGGPSHPSGATTTINFRVGIGSGAGIIAGVYTATSTITVLPL